MRENTYLPRTVCVLCETRFVEDEVPNLSNIIENVDKNRTDKTV